MAGRKSGKLPNPVNYGLWLLNYGPKSKKSMFSALEKRGFSEEVASETVNSMVDWGYLDDGKYKEMLIAKRKQNNVKGRNVVYQELCRDGITDLADLEELYTDEEELEIIERLLDQWGQSTPLDANNRDKYFLRLARRGFAKSNIFQAMANREIDTEIFS